MAGNESIRSNKSIKKRCKSKNSFKKNTTKIFDEINYNIKLVLTSFKDLKVQSNFMILEDL